MANPRFNKQTTNRRGAMGGGMMKRGMYKKGSFPDMSGDGKVTQKDILIAKGVIKKANGGVTEAINGLKKQGLKKGGVAGRLAQRGYGRSR